MLVYFPVFTQGADRIQYVLGPAPLSAQPMETPTTGYDPAGPWVYQGCYEMQPHLHLWARPLIKKNLG